jgi:hypothetical protein
VQLSDNGAVFRVDVRAGSSSAVVASNGTGALLVSSMPALTFVDGEFNEADWSVSTIVDPAVNGPTHSEDRSATGGAPGAYRHMVHHMTAGPSGLRVFNTKSSAVYDPQALGAVLAIDYTEDCTLLDPAALLLDLRSFPSFEQSGRRYLSRQQRSCLPLWANNVTPMTSLGASDFLQVEGPACGSGESCPDFSAGGAPLRFGFERRLRLAAGAPAGSVEHGIDNWKLSVWRP